MRTTSRNPGARQAANKVSRERDEAYVKRNKWMAAFVEIVVARGPADEGDGCACGAPDGIARSAPRIRVIT